MGQLLTHIEASLTPIFPFLRRLARTGAIVCISAGCVPAREPHQPTARRVLPTQAPFACGDLDLYDLDAIMDGGAYEGKCADVPVGTWQQVAADLREATRCDHAPDYVPDPAEACDIAACANNLYEGAAASACDDFTAFNEAANALPCGNLFLLYGSYRLLPC
jgi:hypothetical protein